MRRRPSPRCRPVLPILVGALLTAACGRSPTPPGTARQPTRHDVTAGPVAADAVASGYDPDAADESLRDLLLALQDRFRCNGVSGCAAQDQLVAMGWGARLPLEQVFLQAPAQAPWRARTVAILARLGDPQGEGFFARLLDDRDPEVRAHAIDGLGRIGATRQRQRIWEQAAVDGLWLAPARMAALHVLARWGDERAGGVFSADLPVLAGQPMGTAALVVAGGLCREVPVGSIDCTAGLSAMARHPVFHVRKAAVSAMAARPTAAMASGLVYLTGDQARSIRDAAEGALVQLSGDTSRHGTPAWRAWCDGGGCKADAARDLPLPSSATTQR